MLQKFSKLARILTVPALFVCVYLYYASWYEAAFFSAVGMFVLLCMASYESFS